MGGQRVEVKSSSTGPEIPSGYGSAPGSARLLAQQEACSQNYVRPFAKMSLPYLEWVLQTERMVSGRSSNARIELKSIS